ncbi:hypothetical protein T03_15525 [Trichinella britovi]|uniref:Uncharacterized protein n=1 Tax=Trichinella britovi TaxID=45882 RepID=A0A0V1AMH8_TRIBR|nr:hypothetical protein T03_15525 [Trichinella britovi]
MYNLGDTRVRDLEFATACGFQLNRGVTVDQVSTSMLYRTPPTDPSTVGVSISGDRMTTTGKVRAVLLTLDVRSSGGWG